MKIRIQTCDLELKTGDITAQETEALVNAANSRLVGGGGVDGAIHRTGGPSIMEETRWKYRAGCPTGEAVLTGGGRLKADSVIHAVGPVWKGGHGGEAGQLASAYRGAAWKSPSRTAAAVSPSPPFPPEPIDTR